MKYRELLVEKITKNIDPSLVPYSSDLLDELVSLISAETNSYLVDVEILFPGWEDKIKDILVQAELEPAGHPGKVEQSNITKSVVKQASNLQTRINRAIALIKNPPYMGIVIGDVFDSELNKANMLIEGVDTTDCPGIAIMKIKAQLPFIKDENKKKFVENIVTHTKRRYQNNK